MLKPYYIIWASFQIVIAITEQQKELALVIKFDVLFPLIKSLDGVACGWNWLSFNVTGYFVDFIREFCHRDNLTVKRATSTKFGVGNQGSAIGWKPLLQGLDELHISILVVVSRLQGSTLSILLHVYCHHAKFRIQKDTSTKFCYEELGCNCISVNLI